MTQLGKVKFVVGSILSPEYAGLKFVLNINNMAGKADAPIYKIFDRKWKKIKEEIKGWYANKNGFYKLGIGAINTTAVQSDVWVVNLLCQDESQKTDLKSLEACIKKTYELALYEHASLHISSLLTDSVPELKDLVEKYFTKNGISVSYYTEKS